MSLPVAITAIRGVDFSVALDDFGQVVENLADVDQCIRIILQTPKGSRPHEPLFGCDAWKYLDAPMGEAIPQIIREVAEAVEMWEPRARLLAVTPETEGAALGHLFLRLTWQLPGYDAIQTTEATL